MLNQRQQPRRVRAQLQKVIDVYVNPSLPVKNAKQLIALAKTKPGQLNYASAGRAALLSFEQWSPNSPWEVSTGKVMSPGELTVYPAPPAGS